MKLSVTQLKTERQWRSNTGLDKARFETLLVAFQVAYEQHFNQSIAERQAQSPQDCLVSTYEELFLFTLFSCKADLSYDSLGLVSGFDGSNAKRTEELGITILQSTLTNLGHTPKREVKSGEEFKTFFNKNIVLIVDATEQRRTRPGDYQAQKEVYSGKKSPYNKSDGDYYEIQTH